MEHREQESQHITSEKTGERLMRHLEEIDEHPEDWQPDEDEMQHNFKKIIESASNQNSEDLPENF